MRSLSSSQRPHYHVIIANSFGTLGYMSLILQWTWIVMLYGPYIIDMPLITLFAPLESIDQPAPSILSVPDLPLPLVLIIAGMTLIVLLAAILFVFKLPASVGKAGQKITQSMAAPITPVITRRQVLEPKKQRLLTGRVVIYCKIILILLPFIGLLLLRWLNDQLLDPEISAIVISVTALCSTVMFTLQYATARLWRMIPTQLW